MGRSSGGASRSSGGTSGGGRSSGGFSGGGRSSGGGTSSSSRSSSSSSYRSESRREPIFHHREPRGPREPRWGGPPPPPRGPRPYRARPYRGGYYRRGGASGCSTIFAGIVLLIIIFLIVSAEMKKDAPKSFLGKASSNYELRSTKKRSPLVGVTKKTDFFYDQIGWVKDKNKLQSGLKEFYNKTGVQPYVLFVKYSQVYWTDRELNTTSADSYLESVYDETFSDEGHMIFAYFQCDDDSRDEMEGSFRYLLGHSAQTVMDDEAINIFLGYLDAYYSDTNLSLEEMISKIFSSTANSIM